MACLFSWQALVAQNSTSVKGRVTEKESGNPLIGVNITIKDKLIGTITDTNGDFELSTRTVPPFTIVFSIVGYETQEMEVTNSDANVDVSMIEKAYLGQEVVVSASRVEENIISSPVSIEKMGIIDIQQNSSANFYDGLYQLKGVDMALC